MSSCVWFAFRYNSITFASSILVRPFSFTFGWNFSFQIQQMTTISLNYWHLKWHQMCKPKLNFYWTIRLLALDKSKFFVLVFLICNGSNFKKMAWYLPFKFSTIGWLDGSYFIFSLDFFNLDYFISLRYFLQISYLILMGSN